MTNTDQIVVDLDYESLSQRLLGWYDQAGRELPWRTKGTQRPDPYHVWLSEIMLQQTTVTTVIPYYKKFVRKWPDLKALAASPIEDVLAEWAGLGYYARARNLHKCAVRVVCEYGGDFPEEEQELLQLPGIGPYTAAAISAIAFGRQATVIDGNVERVIARLAAIDTPLPKAKPEIRAIAERLTPSHRPSDYGQAIMDLGATVCRPKSPSCDQCPWRQDCCAAALEMTAEFPRRQKPKVRPLRTGTAFWLESRGHVYLRRRSPEGLLGGMVEVPSSPWIEKGSTDAVDDAVDDTSDSPEFFALDFAPAKADWHPLPGTVRHTFTHFELELGLLVARLQRRPTGLTDGHWVRLADIGSAGLPSVMLKLARHALAARAGERG